MMPSSKKARKVSTVEGEIYVSFPQLTEHRCECGGKLIEIGDCAIHSGFLAADYVTMYSCSDCYEAYEVYHRKQ